MGEELSTAMTLLVVGMITVFVVLSLVYVTGTGLIIFVNRFSADPERTGSTATHPSTVAAITAAVDAITGGRGKVSKIEKEI